MFVEKETLGLTAHTYHPSVGKADRQVPETHWTASLAYLASSKQWQQKELPQHVLRGLLKAIDWRSFEGAPAAQWQTMSQQTK